MTSLHDRHQTLHTIQEASYAPILEQSARLAAHAAYRAHSIPASTTSLGRSLRSIYLEEAEKMRQLMIYKLRTTPTMHERLSLQSLNVPESL